MSDVIKGEVLVPASRFIPKCEHDDPQPYAAIVLFGKTQMVSIEVRCNECTTEYAREDSYGVEGVPHGQANPELKLVDGELKLR